MGKTKKFVSAAALIIGFVCVILIFGTPFANAGRGSKELTPEEVKAKFLSIYRNANVTSVEKSVVSGLYDVVMGQNVVLFDPVGEYMIFGDVMDKTGKNITAQKRDAISASLISTVKLDSALKIGNGPTRVIMFSDPDCPFCTKAKDYFTSSEMLKKVTLYVFFRSLKHMNQAEDERIVGILSAKDPVKAYLNYRMGETAGTVTEEGKKIALAHAEVAGKIGLTAVPTIYIKGQRIMGFDLKRIESVMGN